MGGNALEAAESRRAALRALAEDLQGLANKGHRVVLVHGGGPAIRQLLERLGLPSVFEQGLRVTDAAAMEVVNDALGGVNTLITAELNAAGCDAVGVSGASAGLVTGTVTTGPWGRVAEELTVNVSLLEAMWVAGFVPVVSSVVRDDDGDLLNANADAVAGALAGALRADTLVLLSDVAQLRRHPDDPSSALATVTASEIRELVVTGAIRDGMVPKAQAAVTALDHGASRVVLAYGGTPGAVGDVLSNRTLTTEVRP